MKHKTKVWLGLGFLIAVVAACGAYDQRNCYTEGEDCRGGEGPKGDEGEPGPRGVTGVTGASGKSGKDGRDGVDGKDGKDGSQGLIGLNGTPGIQGPKGETGEQGEQGEKGDQGEAGEKGETGDQGEQGEKGDKGDQGFPGVNGSVVTTVIPCPSLAGSYPEVLLCIDSKLYAVFNPNGTQTRYVEVPAGNYVTTDGRACIFTVVSACTISY